MGAVLPVKQVGQEACGVVAVGFCDPVGIGQTAAVSVRVVAVGCDDRAVFAQMPQPVEPAVFVAERDLLGAVFGEGKACAVAGRVVAIAFDHSAWRPGARGFGLGGQPGHVVIGEGDAQVFVLLACLLPGAGVGVRAVRTPRLFGEGPPQAVVGVGDGVAVAVPFRAQAAKGVVMVTFGSPLRVVGVFAVPDRVGH